MSLAIASRAMPRELSTLFALAPVGAGGGPSAPAYAPPFLWTGPRLIGFCGPAGAGKSTAAAQLVAAHGFTRLRFAGPLKAMMRALGLNAREVDGDLKETPCALLCGRTPRQAMQWLGTEWGRDMVGGRLWIEAWSREQEAMALLDRPVVVDDVRFVDEANAIRARGGVVVRINRPGAGSASGAAHASEALDFAADVEIENVGDLEAFAQAVAELSENRSQSIL